VGEKEGLKHYSIDLRRLLLHQAGKAGERALLTTPGSQLNPISLARKRVFRLN